jgi:hypothetical protein
MFGVLIPAVMFIAHLIPGSEAHLSDDDISGLLIIALVFGVASYFLFSLGGAKFSIRTILLGFTVFLLSVASEAVKTIISGSLGEFVSLLLKTLVLVGAIVYVWKDWFMTMTKYK